MSGRRLAVVVALLCATSPSTAWLQQFVAPTDLNSQITNIGTAGTATAALSGTAVVVDGAIVFDGALTTASPNALVVTTTEVIDGSYGDLVIGLNVSYGSVDNNFRQLFNLDGVVGALHSLTVWLGNRNRASSNCARGFDISEAWPANTVAELVFTIDSLGAPLSFAINGNSIADESGWPYRSTFQGACQPVRIASGAKLYVGGAGLDATHNNNFAGSLTSFGFSASAGPPGTLPAPLAYLAFDGEFGLSPPSVQTTAPNVFGTVSFVPGIRGQAAYFNNGWSVSNYITVQNTAGSGPLSIMFWVALDPASFVFSDIRTAGFTNPPVLNNPPWLNSGMQIDFSNGQGAPWYNGWVAAAAFPTAWTHAWSQIPTSSYWTHVAVVVTAANEVIIYTNGTTTSGAMQGSTPMPGAEILVLGRSANDDGSSLIGSIDEVYLYGGALTAAQVNENMNLASHH